MNKDNKREHFLLSQQNLLLSASGIVIYLVGAIMAGWFSWTCNATHGFGIVAKILFSLLAALGSWGYLVAYSIYKWGTC
jgi:hypothetical protein